MKFLEWNGVGSDAHRAKHGFQCDSAFKVPLVRKSALVPVTMGSPQFFTLHTEHFSVTEAFFPPNVTLEPHTHDRPILATMLRGGFRTAIAGRSLDCHAGRAWTEPLGEQHANYAGDAGAHVMVIQPDARDEEFLLPFARLLGEVHHLGDPGLMVLAPRVLCELGSGDALASLSVEALVTSLMAAAVRRTFSDRTAGGAPGWLLRLREMIHADWRSASLANLSRSVDMHPCYVAHSFKTHFGESVGSYARRLRVGWATSEVRLSRRPISQVALDAGFSDQAHFTRECRKYSGLTPAEYRRRAQSAKSAA